ncbi:GNAT family protein [Streptosporangium sandarakinum]|uniref:GNAT family protein n=1 Tax=Streptosporangium sandarakinum TaxID=1260955 RepID=UPI0033B513BA
MYRIFYTAATPLAWSRFEHAISRSSGRSRRPRGRALKHQGKGYEAEARAGLLALAFDHLDARAARTEVFQDDHAPQGVSRKLGHEHDGVSADARGDEAVMSDRLRLIRQKRTRRNRRPVRGDAMTTCRPMSGL